MGFPCIPCLSMKHVADGRRGFFSFASDLPVLEFSV